MLMPKSINNGIVSQNWRLLSKAAKSVSRPIVRCYWILMADGFGTDEMKFINIVFFFVLAIILTNHFRDNELALDNYWIPEFNV